jgi:hypothetical protein
VLSNFSLPISNFIKIILISNVKNNEGNLSSAMLFILLSIIGTADGVKYLLARSIPYLQFNFLTIPGLHIFCKV